MKKLDGIDLSIIADMLKVKADFNDEEKERLIENYKNGDLNQYYSIIILKVLAQKKFSLDNHTVITGLISVLDQMDTQPLQIKTDEDIINTASTLYKLLMILDIKEIYNIEF